ncbi:MAG: helix-turn-helix transcriptional regulator [Rhodospirillales bacterium]|nr:helix-turn-helix transcriptional regulator [Rhodospirillales bacterium]
MRYSKDHSDKTRDAVLTAAAVKFREDGFSGVGVNAIAASAQVTSGAIYSHFGSKDALFSEVVEGGRRRQGLAARLHPLLSGRRACRKCGGRLRFANAIGRCDPD